jgi:carbamoyl-phosphate synthase large subunit
MSKPPRITVLITSAGGAAGVNCIRALRKQAEIDTIRIVAADANVFSAGLYLADVGYTVPRVEQIEYMDHVIDICIREGVDVVLPTLSVEIARFASDRVALEQCGTRLLVSPLRSILVFEDKLLAYRFFQEHGILTPSTWSLDEVPSEIQYPLVFKPRIGSGSRDTHRIEASGDLAFFADKASKPAVVQEYVTGPEYTVDVIADCNSEVLAAVPRERMHVRQGMAVVARTAGDKAFLAEVKSIVSLAGLVGPLNVQGFLVNGEFWVTDVNTRFAAGGLPLTLEAGVNIPLMAVKLALGLPVAPIEYYTQDIVMLRYYTETFIY